MSGRRAAWLVLTAALAAAATPVRAQDDGPPPDGTGAAAPAVVVTDLPCERRADALHTEAPRLVYDDRPDLLYELLLGLEDGCEIGEPAGRMRILASIWDGVFDEGEYGFEVIDWLAERWDPHRAPPAGSNAQLFDAFTVDFAAQLLPHQDEGSVAEFFCLFYGGQPEAAWPRLEHDELADSWLQYYYDEEIAYLENLDPPYLLTGYWGGWDPGGDLGRVGRCNLAGGMVEQWTGSWFFRLAIEVRAGRSASPYFVTEKGVDAFSDRWNALLLAGETGLGLWRRGRHHVEGFVGIGYDTVAPFKDADWALATWNLALGAGWRMELDRGGRIFSRLDGRCELIGDRNPGGTPLGGHAWSFRLGLGVRLGENPEPRLRALGRTEP